MSQKVILEAEDPNIWADEVRLALGGTVVGRVVTTDGSATTLLSLALLPSRTTLLRVQVIARRTGGSGGTAQDGAAYLLAAAYKMVAGTPTLIGSIGSLFSAEDQAGWNATLDVSGGNVRVRVTGAANNNVSWNGKVHIESIEQ
jgi:hypothetical protein